MSVELFYVQDYVVCENQQQEISVERLIFHRTARSFSRVSDPYWTVACSWALIILKKTVIIRRGIICIMDNEAFI